MASRNNSSRPRRSRATWAALALMLPLAAAACGPTAAPQKNPDTGTHTAKQARTGTARNTGTARAGGKNSGASTVKPLSLTTLPPMSYEMKLNPWLRHTHEVSSFITNMGYHWAAPVPSLVLMTNNAHQVAAVEADFPQKLGTYPWFDPPDTAPNGGVAFNSEHLYFVPPTSITPTMSATVPTNLASWTSFEMANPRLSSTYVKQTRLYHGDAVYAPNSGPAIQVLVDPTSGKIAGFVVAEPAHWGWRPIYAQRRGKPVASKLYGKAYDSVLWLLPPKDGSAPGHMAGARHTAHTAVKQAQHTGKKMAHQAKNTGNKAANQTKSTTRHAANKAK